MSVAGKTVFITGSTDGVGRVVAGMLARAGARVLLHGRDAGRAHEVQETVHAATGRDDTPFYRADLSSLKEVERLAQMLQREYDHLDVLINNAGIGSGPPGDSGRKLSADSFELRFAVNYLAHFLLTARLLPLLIAAAPARIVNVSSLGQQALDFDDIMLERGYSGTRAYCQSKLAQVLFTIDLAQRLASTGVTVNSLHPATFMNTTMVRQAGRTPASKVEEGAEAIVRLAASPELEGKTGLFFSGLREARADAQAYDPAARAKLRELSLRLTALTEKDFSSSIRP
jgi:NAD(P)-dependent dehydrogenase (short-subunit alcohol dehydrogenase family)